MKRLAIAILFSVLMVSDVYGMTCHELTMSYILNDQDLPQKAGDIFYGSEDRPMLMDTTAYYRGDYGSHGDKMREGYCAGDPDLYGAAVTIYEAIETEDGYKIGDCIGIFELKDTGYGKSTHTGTSRVRSDKRYAGTIESGTHLDIYRNDLSRCREWMHRTQGKIFAVITPAKG